MTDGLRPGTRPFTRLQRLAGAGLLFIVSLQSLPLLAASGYDDRRVEIGLRLFRSLLAADLDLDKKRVEDGKLLVVFFYVDERRRAETLAGAFGARGEPVRGFPILVEPASDETFAAYSRRPPAGVFLTEVPKAATLNAVVRFGIEHRIIIYSPFEGHVEKGVLGGLAVEAQVRPYVNLTTLGASNISLKDFFLKVAKVTR